MFSLPGYRLYTVEWSGITSAGRGGEFERMVSLFDVRGEGVWKGKI